MHAHEHEHEHDESAHPPKTAAPHTSAELPHLLRAAAAGRTDVLGQSGMNTLQRTVGNSAVGEVLQREPEEEQHEQPQRSSVALRALLRT